MIPVPGNFDEVLKSPLFKTVETSAETTASNTQPVRRYSPGKDNDHKAAATLKGPKT